MSVKIYIETPYAKILYLYVSVHVCPPLMPILGFTKDKLALDEIAIPIQPLKCGGYINAWKFYALVVGEVTNKLSGYELKLSCKRAVYQKKNIFLSNYVSMSKTIYLSQNLPICLDVYVSVSKAIYLSLKLTIYI